MRTDKISNKNALQECLLKRTNCACYYREKCRALNDTSKYTKECPFYKDKKRYKEEQEKYQWKWWEHFK